MAQTSPTKPCPFTAQAFVDDVLVATSKAAVQVASQAGLPLLCFPQADVQGKLPADTDLLSSEAPGGYVAFAQPHDRVRVVVVDDMGCADERDHTLKRFPTWGDTSHLVDILNVRPDGEKRYVSVTRDNAANPHRSVAEGSQLLGQAIVAGSRHAPGRRVVHASMMFLRAANATDPLHFELDEHTNGRTFTALGVKVLQGPKLCASGVLLLNVTAPSVMEHRAPAPAAPPPYETPSYDMGVTHRDVRFVDNAYTGDPNAPVGPPTIDTWLRYQGVPADSCLHAALLAHFTGHVSIATAMRPHAGIGQAQAHRSLSTAISAINISFHADIQADHWMLYRHHSTFAGDGMTHSECRVHTAEGGLVASFTVDAMVRGMSTDRPVNPRTAL